jgi:hypothetical protein
MTYKTEGNLDEIGIRPGDVVRCTYAADEWWTVGKEYQAYMSDDVAWVKDDVGSPWREASGRRFTIVSRAGEETPSPTAEPLDTIAEFWTAYAGKQVTTCDVDQMLKLLDIARMARR